MSRAARAQSLEAQRQIEAGISEQEIAKTLGPCDECAATRP